MMRTTVENGFRIHTLWTVKDTSAMSGTVLQGGGMLKGTITLQEHVTAGYQSIKYWVRTVSGEVGRGATIEAALKDIATVTSTYVYRGQKHWVVEVKNDLYALFEIEVHKEIGDGADPEPELVGLDQLEGLNVNTKRVMEDASGFGLGGRAKYQDYWTTLSWANGSGFFTARQDEGSGQYLMGTHTVHGTGDYSFSVMGRKDLVIFQTREGGAKSIQYIAYHSGNVEKMVDAILANPSALAKLKAALATPEA